MRDEDRTKEDLVDELRAIRLQMADLKASEAKHKEAEEHLRKLYRAVEQSPVTIMITDHEGRIEYVNPKFIELTGYTPEETIGQNPRILNSGEHPPEFYKELWDTISSGKVWRGVFRNKKKNGEFFWENATISPVIKDKGRITHYIAVKEDITDSKNAAEALGESEKRYRAVIQTAIEAIITSDNKGNIMSWNRGAQNIFGYGEEEALGKQLTILMPERYRDKHTGGMERLRLTGEARIIGKTVRLHGLTKDGREFPLELSLASWKTRGEEFYTGIINDITERVRMEEKLEKSATTDELTQAYNRAKFEEIIAREIEKFERYRQLLSIIMLDIDDFKEVNDTYGHIVGDSVLKTLVGIIRRNKRGIDWLVRWGGEEFMVVAPGIDLEGVEKLAERLRKAIESYKFDTVGRITISLGATQFRQGDTEDSFIKRVDDAMYKAKMTGKNRLVIGT